MYIATRGSHIRDAWGDMAGEGPIVRRAGGTSRRPGRDRLGYSSSDANGVCCHGGAAAGAAAPGLGRLQLVAWAVVGEAGRRSRIARARGRLTT